MGKYKSRPRLRTRHLKIRCFAQGCKVLAVRFIDAGAGSERMWYCTDHHNERVSHPEGFGRRSTYFTEATKTTPTALQSTTAQTRVRTT
jgi:hypothetical protein